MFLQKKAGFIKIRHGKKINQSGRSSEIKTAAQQINVNNRTSGMLFHLQKYSRENIDPEKIKDPEITDTQK